MYEDFRPDQDFLNAISKTLDINNGYVAFEGIRVLNLKRKSEPGLQNNIKQIFNLTILMST